MKEEQHQFLRLLGRLPARLTAEQAAWVLNCQVHDIPALIAAKLLKPLGNPPANGIKYFATADLLETSKDQHWLTRMSTAIYQHWQKKNARKNLPVAPLCFPSQIPLSVSLPVKEMRSSEKFS
jgi:hypothetical protein